MIRAYKTEINPTPEQIKKINQTIGVCRFIYNFYLAHNQEMYTKTRKFISGMEFSKWLNNEFLPHHPEYSWIKEVGSKAVKQTMMNGDKAFRRFFNGWSGFPKFKKKKDQNVKAYFPKNNKGDWTVERHRIQIPTIGKVKLKEKGYLPTNATIKSGTVSQKAGRYYVSIVVDELIQSKGSEEWNDAMGIDLGITNFATLSNQEQSVININKTSKVKKLEKSLKRQQRKLSRKYEGLKKRIKNNEKERTATRRNIQKQVLKVQRLHQRLSNIRENHVNQTVHSIVEQKPRFIAIEDLNVRGMMKNRHLAKAVVQQRFNQFCAKLTTQCKANDIELRVVDRFYPSSKLCSHCGYKKSDLKLSDRVYMCNHCGLKEDRDRNAAINLKNAKVYKIA